MPPETIGPIEPGQVALLRAVRLTPHGPVFADDRGREVLLPARYAPENLAVGQTLTLFIHTDSEDRLVATTERPLAVRGEAAPMRVVATTRHGAFVDWGLPKDLFVPRALQRAPMREGEQRIVYVDIDPKTGRPIGTERFEKRLARADVKRFKRNQPVEALLFKRTDMGYKAVVEKRFDGLLLHSEVFAAVSVGDRITAYVKRIRDDGKIDLLTRPIGKKSDLLAAETVTAYLHRHGGMMPLNYKSDPQRIGDLLGLSRKNFKRALTRLIDAGIIEVKENGTYLRRKR